MTRRLYALVGLVASFTCIFYFLVLDRGSYHYLTENLRESPENAASISNKLGRLPSETAGNLAPLSNKMGGMSPESSDSAAPTSNKRASVPPESSIDGKRNPAAADIQKSPDAPRLIRDSINVQETELSFRETETSDINISKRTLEFKGGINQTGRNIEITPTLDRVLEDLFHERDNKEAWETQELARHLLPNSSVNQQGVKHTGCPTEYKIEGPDDNWFRTKVTQRSPLANLTDDRPYVVILTPISNSERSLQMYFNNLCSLDYPHNKISVVLGEDSSNDRTTELATKHVEKLKPYFRRMEFVKLRSFGTSGSGSGSNRHAVQYQFVRRKHLAMSRNQLILAGIRDETWVLWIDSDVKHIPTNILERLVAVRKQIVVPNCLYRRDDGMTDTFDRNTWRETETSRKFLESSPDHFLMLEGYEPTRRHFLNDLKEEGDVVRLDGVGGCVLLVEADLHRTGLVFPAFTFEHHIETEGLSKMAAKMDVKLYGLPSVNVIHA